MTFYIDDCRKCKCKISQEIGRFSNHCSTCLELITGKRKKCETEVEKLNHEYEDFSSGKDL